MDEAVDFLIPPRDGWPSKGLDSNELFTVSAESMDEIVTVPTRLPKGWPTNHSDDCQFVTVPTAPDGWPVAVPTTASLGLFNRMLTQLDARPPTHSQTFEGLPTLFFGQNHVYSWSLGPSTIQEAVAIGMNPQRVPLHAVLADEADIHDNVSDSGLMYRRPGCRVAQDAKVSRPSLPQGALHSSTRACVLGHSIKVGPSLTPRRQLKVRI